MKTVSYACDRCRKTIVPESWSAQHSEVSEGEVESREMLTVQRTLLVGTVVTESTRYEFHFCSHACLGDWAQR